MSSDEELRKKLLKPLDEIRAKRRESDDNMPITSSQSSKDDMSLMKYVSNPTGKGSAYVANRSAIKQGLNMTYIKLLRNFRREFYAVPYIYPNGDILFYVKVPSEFYKDNKISYDVLFLLKYDKSKNRSARAIQMFSNSPSFVYTYCYVYNKAGLIIDNLKSKYPTEALTKFPEIRNPIGSFGYEKSTYIAARYLIDGRCLTDGYINLYGKKMDSFVEADVLNKIADPALLVSIYQTAQYQKRKTHKKEISANEKKRREEQKEKYEKEQKKNRPTSGFIVHHSPRSKITARKARKSLLNDYKK